MIHFRLVSPPAVAGDVLARLEAIPSVCAVAHLRGVARRPNGDLILCDVAREDASVVVEELRGLGLDRDGVITLTEIHTAISESARRAERAAAGAIADAVVWEEVEERTSESAELSGSFLAFMALAVMIASAGILTDSLLLIIGAMIVGPDYGPLAGICVAAAERRPELARRSFVALVAGFAVAIPFAIVLTAVLRAAGKTPDELGALTQPATLFISRPNVYSVIVAVLAGVAGTLALTTAKSGALIGVLVSVTTIPAAANVGVATAYGDWSEARGALAQLGVNIVAIVAAGTVTLIVQRELYARRRGRIRARLGEPR